MRYGREMTAPGMWSEVHDRLIALGPRRTLWENNSVYRFESTVMSVLGRFLTRMFRKQSQQHLEDFKAFAENGTDVRGSER